MCSTLSFDNTIKQKRVWMREDFGRR
jgi:hypothetical protein